MKKSLIILFAATVSLASISAAWADETSKGQLTVKATLKDGCSIKFGNGNSAVIDFGTISALANSMTQEGQFTVACSDLQGTPTSYKATSVSLNEGNAPGSAIENRLLINGDSTLQFQVYQGSENTGSNVIWGDGSSGSAPSYSINVNSGAATTYDYHVTLLAQDLKNKTVGLYQNTMIATVNYTVSGA